MKGISMNGSRRMSDSIYIGPRGSVSWGTYDAHRRFLVAERFDARTLRVVRLRNGKYLVSGNLAECCDSKAVFNTVRDCVDAITRMTNKILRD